MRTIYLLPVAAIALSLAAGCKQAPEANPAPPTPNQGPPMPGPGGPGGPPMPGGPAPTGAAQGTTGKAIYAASCAVCHGEKGEGKIAGSPKFTDASWQAREKDAVLIEAVRKGKGTMPGWEGKLSEKQMTDVVAYIRTLAPPKK